MTFKRSNIEQQVPNLPHEVKWCSKCVVSNQKPRVVFDNEGICSGCKNTYYKNHVIDWEKRENELLALLD